MSRKPLIGVTLDAEPAGGWSKLPWYALRQNYFSAVIAAGGLPVALPHHPELALEYLDALDGLLVTGGAFDVDPALWGGGAPHPKVTLKPGRTDFELAAVRAALARDLPVLGICGGQQLLAVAFGGTLVQHIPDEVPGALAHEQPNPRTEPGHEVTLSPGTRLAHIVGAARMAVNSAHHQAVATPGSGIVNALAPDGVIEGIEHPAHRFALGVQWHPEYAVDPRDPLIFGAFVEAARA
jgi:putative glutamine amidotransferase